MRKNPISMRDIQHRQERIDCIDNNTDNASILEAIIELPGVKKMNNDDMIRRLFSYCKDTTCAEKCMPYFSKYMNEASDEQVKYLVNEFTNYIAPVIVNNGMALRELSKIEDTAMRETCEAAIKDNITIDKILENHARISKLDTNGNMEYYNFTRNLEYACREVCEWIDRYNIKGYAKMQIALEELQYLAQKSGHRYSSSDLVKYVTEHYLALNEVSQDIARKILELSNVITENDTYHVRYIFNEYKSDEVSNAINAFKMEGADESKLKILVSKIYTKSPEQIIDGTPNLLAWLRQLLVLGTLGTNIIVGCVIILADKFVQMSVSRKQLEKMYTVFNREKSKTKNAIDKAKTRDEKDRLQEYLDALDKSMTEMDMYKNKFYTYDELKKQDEIEEESCNMAPVTLEEFKTFKFNNLLSLAADASNYIQDSYNKGVKKIRAKVKSTFKQKEDPDVDKDGNLKKKQPIKIPDNLKNGLKAISSHFTESAFDANLNLFDAVLIAFDVSESTAEEVYDFMTGICEDMSNRYSKINNVKFYVNTAGDKCEIHAVDTTPIMLTESEYASLGYFNENDLDTVREIFYKTGLILTYESLRPTEILSDLLESSIAFDKAYMVMDLYKYSGMSGVITESESLWGQLISKYTNTNYAANDYIKINENTMINGLEYSTHVTVPFDIQVESCKIMRAILNESIDTSGIKAAIIGMKDKVKNLTVKEKEISKNMDVAASGFSRSLENALTNDRREAIIKGSLIPSFSKCVKVALAAGATSVIVDPMVAVIGLMGTLAGSRYLNNKERMLLLDEIEVELKVVEKEIQKAENDDDMAKYRKLLTYQKKLKKEDFKLRYNVSRKMGKDYLTRKDDDKE